jgi:hypothetical protein
MTTDEEYERGSLALMQIFSNKVPDQISAPIKQYIADASGVNPRDVSETVFRTLARRDQEVIIKRLAPYAKYPKIMNK